MGLASSNASREVDDSVALPDCPGNVNQRVRAVEKGQGGLMSVHEPLLHIMLRVREEKAQPAELFDLQHSQAVIFRDLPYRFGEDFLRQNLGHAVEEICDDPVKHFNQEGKLLQDAAMQMVVELRGVWGMDDEPATSSTVRRMLECREGRFGIIIIIIRARCEKLIGRGDGIGFVEDRLMIAISLPSEHLKLPPSGHNHGSNQNTENNLHR